MLYWQVIAYLASQGISNGAERFLSGDVSLRDDGSGPYIASWNTDALGAKPSAATLSGQITTAIQTTTADRIALRDAVADQALVLVRLTEWVLANTTMQASDFRGGVRKAYLDAKAIADRLDPSD